MATVVNLIPAETQQSVSSQTTNKKDSTASNKSTGFAKLLNNQSDKNQKDDANTKADTNVAQSILAMLGMALPVTTNVSNATQSDQSNSELANNLVVDGTAAAVQSPAASLVGKVSTGFDVTMGMNTSKNQLAALLTKVTDAKTEVDSNPISQFTQVQLQNLLQSKQTALQVQAADIPAKQVDLTVNNALFGTLTSAVAADISNGTGKNNNTQLDNKKTTAGTVTTSDLAQLVGAVDTKTVNASQSTANVVDATANTNDSSTTNTLLLGGKEQVNSENILPDQTVKSTDAFASLLNQQVVKNENPITVTDTKQVSQQPVSDPYNIASQIVDQARLVTGQKNTEMIIQLKPEHLGELTLKVTVESGVVSASFHSNNSEVRNIIEASLPQLKQDLSNQGLKIENVGVYAGLGEFFSNGQQRESRGRTEVKVQNKKTEEDFLEALEGTSSLEPSVEGSGVDYRI